MDLARPTMNSRERSVKRGLALLGENRFLEFIRAVSSSPGCRAVELIATEIETGAELKDIFFTGDEFGYWLKAKVLGADRFSIEFGCQAGPLAGDGGEWEVGYNKEGSVHFIDQSTEWIS
jgi:hypothetical protein